MRFAITPAAALLLLAGCGAAEPTPEEEALPETASGPELTANSAASGMGNASTATTTPGPEAPGGPVSDQGSGAGDTAPTH